MLSVAPGMLTVRSSLQASRVQLIYGLKQIPISFRGLFGISDSDIYSYCLGMASSEWQSSAEARSDLGIHSHEPREYVYVYIYIYVYLCKLRSFFLVSQGP